MRDKAGNGYAVIRFLPGKEENGTPWVRYWDHAFKGPTGQWYIEKSLTSLGQNDPLSELNMKMWNSGDESQKKIVSSRKRTLRYVANVLVISDQQNPQNEGQVKLYRFGAKIFDKIKAAMQPQSLVLRSLIRSKLRCNLNSLTRSLSTHLICGKVLTL